LASVRIWHRAHLTGHPQNFPDHQYPSIVGRPILRSEERDGDIVVKDIMCGDEAAAARSMLQITYPVRRYSASVAEALVSARLR
jgi:hypothetical protein